MKGFRQRLRRLAPFLAGTALLLAAVLVALHWSIQRLAELVPPSVSVEPIALETTPREYRRAGAAYVRARGALLEVGLSGNPETIGYSLSRLLYPEMVEIERVLLARFGQQIPSRLARRLLLDLAELRYRNVDQGMSRERRAEIAAQALGFQPDPYAGLFPTYQRFVYLNALYDISLSFEDSPLVGCTTFVFGSRTSESHGGLLARAFDFEYDPIFDRKKAVFVVRESGMIPFVSVSWPGLIGVVSGMNAEGVAAVVHGGRAGQPETSGEPLLHAVRRALSTARTSAEAAARIDESRALVSHIVILTDASGDGRVLERVPGRATHFEQLPESAAVTNHFAGPARADPRNRRVEERTSTLARRARGDELISELEGRVGVARAVTLLRDRKGAGGKPLPLGDRAAIDALIATHGVVMDTRNRTLWVSEAPHLLGRFVAFELEKLLAPDYDPAAPGELANIAADPLLTSGDYARFRAE